MDHLLRLAKALGLFALARALTAGRLRILCYHGIALDDEHRFQPMLFMRPQTFAARMSRLVELGYPVLRLSDALQRLSSDSLPRCAVVITIDDGWYGTYRHMAPVLARLGLPATLYLSTYYLEKQTQVFNVAAAYALWKRGSGVLNLAEVAPQLSGRFDLASSEDRDAAAEQFTRFGDSLGSAAERQRLLEHLFEVLNLRFEPVRDARMLCFMAANEAAALIPIGIDLQLHTHRHRFPGRQPDALAAEIAANRESLARFTTGPRSHLCYPSGNYSAEAFGTLAALGIVSATTTRPGMNTRDTLPLELRRFLDSEDFSEIRFEAELSGFLHVARRMTGRLGPDP